MATTEPRTTPITGPATDVEHGSLVKLLLEWRIVAAMIIGVLLVTSLPYIYAYTTTPPGVQYVGLTLGVPDHLQYFSWMRDLSHQNLAPNRLTPEPNEPAFFNLLWWISGRFSVLTGLDYRAIFSILRVLAVALCLSCGYAFIRTVVAEQRQRQLAFAIFALGGGMGFVWVVVKYLLRLADVPFPDDLYTAEANTFFMSLSFPHFTLALALLTGSFALVLIALREKKLSYAVAAGAFAIVLGLQHTYDLLTIYLVLSLFGALLWARDRKFPLFFFFCGLIVVGMSAPPALYMFLLVKLSPIWGEVLAQFDNAGVFTPSIPHLLLLLGVPFWLALIGFRPRMLQSRSDSELFVAVWFVAHVLLAYMPTDFQIHMLLGWQVPMAVLAAAALKERVWPFLVRRVGGGGTRAVVGVLVALMLFTNIYIVGWRFLDLSRYQSPYYLMNDEVAALNWLEANTTNQDVVLSDLAIGQFIPMWSDSRAFLAHWANTLDYFGKQELARHVLTPSTSDQERRAVLDHYAVTYLIYRQDEATPASGLATPYLTPVFQQGQLTIYQYNRGS